MQSKTIVEQKAQIKKLKSALRVALRYLKADERLFDLEGVIRRLEKQCG